MRTSQRSTLNISLPSLGMVKGAHDVSAELRGSWQSGLLVEHSRLDRSVSGGSLHTPHLNGHRGLVVLFFVFRFVFLFFKYKHTMTERMGKKAIVNVSKFLEDGRQMVITRRVAEKAEG